MGSARKERRYITEFICLSILEREGRCAICLASNWYKWDVACVSHVDEDKFYQI